MTSTQAEIDRSQLGTLSVLAWIGDPSEAHDIPYLLAYTLGDGPKGREAGEAAARGRKHSEGHDRVRCLTM